MKVAVALTLIVMGTLLILTPPISDFLHQQNVVALMTKPGITNVLLLGEMKENYRFGCWLTGSGMIAVAVLGSLLKGREASAG